MPRPERQQSVLELLKSLRGLDPLKKLFWSELNYQRVNQSLSLRGWPDAAASALADNPVLFAGGVQDNDFHVIYARLTSEHLRLGDERPVVSRLLKDHPYALFAFSNSSQNRWHFLNVKYDDKSENRRLFRRITIGQGERLRTASERLAMLDLEAISPDLFGLSPLAIQQRHEDAFNVEAVTKKFFEEYALIFARVEGLIQGIKDPERKRLFTQRLFNRLMFIAFIQKKGWLKLNADTDYLSALWKAYQQDRSSGGNFYNQRLKTLFFLGLNTPNEVNLININRGGFLRDLIGEVPYLNGGLFEQDEDDLNEKIVVPDESITAILNDLFDRFNFTVTESTPLDVEVAVDPEMLGKVFEELVTGRHETGSYYTPKPIVSFMGREALKRYLASKLPEESVVAIEEFVDDHDPTGLRNPEMVLDALRSVKACDPACGSGAYLLGMLHELIDLRQCLFVTKKLDTLSVYDRKLEIILNSIYGVDLDPFAVNIARLRLWLSLAVDFEGDHPPPLPNLDFKIEAGDSLSAPDPSGGEQPDMYRQGQIENYYGLKAKFLMAHGSEKLELRKQIEVLRKEIAQWAHQGHGVAGFDWQVEFAEVFKPEVVTTTIAGELNLGHQLTEQPQPGGFDIIVANPPYVRHALITDLKPAMKAVFPAVYTGTADLYVYFYARAHQLLRDGGVGCFISSSKWLRSGYGEKLRQYLLDTQAFQMVVDFGELPVFEAVATFPAIFLWQKYPRGNTSTIWAVVKDLQACYEEGIREHVYRIAQTVPASQFGIGKPRLTSSSTADQRIRMERSGTRLGNIVRGRMFRGVVTGLNDVFYIDRETKDYLVAEDSNSAEVIKPVLMGDDVRRYEAHFRDNYLVFIQRGLDIKRYPAILAYLKTHRKRLEPKPSDWNDKRDGKWPGRKAGNYKWYEIQDATDYATIFDEQKIIFPQTGKEPRFSMDTKPYYIDQTVYTVAVNDWYILAVLNSLPAFEWLKTTCAVLGDEEQGGRLRVLTQYLEEIPIPDASNSECKAVGKMAQDVQRLHAERRKLVEKFLRNLGDDPTQSSSRNIMEQPWTLTTEEITKYLNKTRTSNLRLVTNIRDETMEITQRIEKVEREIDERVAKLYGL